MDLFLIYLWLKLDTFVLFAGFFAGIGFFIWGFLCIPVFAADEREREGLWYKPVRLLWKSGGFAIVFSCLMWLVLPTSKDVAILVGSSIAIDMAKSPEGHKIGALIRGKANEFLDEELKKLEQKK